MALEVVLRDLERLGYTQFLKRFTEHIDNLHDGAEFMADAFAERHEHSMDAVGDKYGVSWDAD